MNAANLPPYAELGCQSAFSFLRGASDPELLVERARALGYRALAVADRDGVYGSPRLHAAGRRHELPVIHGTTLTLERGPVKRYDGGPAGADDRVVLLARAEPGWRRLCELVSAARQRSRREPFTPRHELERACALRADEGDHGLLALLGPHLPDADVEALREAFGAEHVALAIHDRLLKRDRRGQAVQRARSQRLGLPLVVTGGVRFARREDKPVHDVLACVRHKLTLDQAATRLLPNAEFCLRPVARIARLFRHCPDAVARSAELAARCSWTLDALAYRFPPFEVPAGETPFSQLHELVHAGARRRYRPLTPPVARQLAKELDMIERLDLAGYFLVVHDIVAFCEREGILCQGRGSAANSAVCYALGITSVDPVGMQLLFERFLSEERGEVPDIDLDIAHQDRERVLQYVYRHYGRDHAALAAESITWRTRSAVRDVGKALGFTASEVDGLAKSVDRRFDADRDSELPEAWSGLADDPRMPHLVKLVAGLRGLPRHLSIHVGGMIITGPKLTELMPVEPAAMKDRTVVPWDKDDLAGLGIIKIDLLGLGMLTVLDRSLRLVNAHGLRGGASAPGEDAAHADAYPSVDSARGTARVAEPEPLQLHTVPSDDEATWDLLCAADTVGVFQVESRAQMNCLPRLRPRTFYDLVIEVALIRPGPIQGDMVHPFLRRRQGREPVSYPHPSLAPILERTLGVPLFQEQGMKIAVAAAGFSAGEADELRRAMGHKRSHERMGALSERLVTGMVRGGIDEASAQNILKQLSAFADYGFPESHAASFARLVWVSAWLKRHHPDAFLCALLNAQPMGFYAPAVLVSDAQRHGVTMLPVDVLRSDWDCTLEAPDAESDAESHGARDARDARDARGTHDVRDARGTHHALHASCPRRLAVRLGLCTVRGLGEGHEAAVRAGLASVAERGPFASPEDFAARTGVGRRIMEHLARLGALRGFDTRRRQALWRVARMARKVPGPLAAVAPPEAPVELPEPSQAETLREDYRIGGITLGGHPLGLLRATLDRLGVRRARELASGLASSTGRSSHHDPGGLTSVAGLVICRQRPATAKGMTFLTLEDETGFTNLVVTPPVAVAQREALGAALLLARGRLEQADGVVNLRVVELQPLDDARVVEGLSSHDWH